MGYRSEVKGLIYGTADEMEAFKEACFDLYNQVREEFGDEITDESNDKFKLLYLNAPYTKWYDEYEEVQHWQEMYDLARETGMNVEFARAGEEQGDVELDFSGKDCEYYLEMVQRIDAHFHRGGGKR